MSKRTLYTLAGVFLFFLFTLSNLPLAAVLKWSKAKENGLSWQRVEGTLWYGQIQNASYQAYPVGTISLKTKFFPLLIGRASSQIVVSGVPLKASGHISGSLGGRVNISDTALIMDLGRYNIRDAFDLPMEGLLRLDISTLELVKKSCEAGEFRVWTDSLVSTAKRYKGTGFPLEGQGKCEEGVLTLPVTGEGGSEVVRLDIMLQNNLDYIAEVKVKSQTPGLIAALQLYGFDTKGDQLVMIQRGNLLTNP